MLEQAGLKLGEIKKVQDASAKKNVVLACNPGVGSNLNDGAAVAITVAAGGEKKSAYVDFVVPSGKPANVRPAERTPRTVAAPAAAPATAPKEGGEN